MSVQVAQRHYEVDWRYAIHIKSRSYRGRGNTHPSDELPGKFDFRQRAV